MIAELATVLQMVKAGLSGWAQIKAAIQGGHLTVHDDQGQPMPIVELEPHILRAEDAKAAASAHAADRISRRHPEES